MKLVGVLAALLAAVLTATPQEKPRITRAALVTLEKSFDARLSAIGKGDPLDLLGSTRGVYLEGYGVVFTAEVSLIPTPTITPFQSAISKEQAEMVHRKKLERLPALKQAIREMLVTAAASLDALPPNEQVAIGMTFFYYSWENRTSLPLQLLMQAPKSSLMDYRLGKSTSGSLEAAIRLQEF